MKYIKANQLFSISPNDFQEIIKPKLKNTKKIINILNLISRTSAIIIICTACYFYYFRDFKTVIDNFFIHNFETPFRLVAIILFWILAIIIFSLLYELIFCFLPKIIVLKYIKRLENLQLADEFPINKD